MHLASALALLIAGCGGDDVDLSGTYAVDAAVESAPCGADLPVTSPPAYLKFSRGDLFGATYFSYQTCTDAAATDCAGSGLFGDAFSEPIDGGWLGVITATFGSGSTCTVSYTEQTATLAGRALVIEIHRYATVVDVAALCTTDEAQRRNTSMPCDRHERIDASKL